MFIFYDPNTLKMVHAVIIAPPEYREFLLTKQDEHWIETDENITPEEVEVMPDKTIRRRVPMNISAPNIVSVGELHTITGVPEGISISVNGVNQGVMDSSQHIEFEPQIAGEYIFRFEGSGYIALEKKIEVIN
jgi:hypothetical protein